VEGGKNRNKGKKMTRGKRSDREEKRVKERENIAGLRGSDRNEREENLHLARPVCQH